ncbi:MAG TPA: metallophosphoesterase [Thermoanaerobaculia bacterium]|nr:metallophosphoesterase [Thermoanaerobaculia bacterium]
MAVALLADAHVGGPGGPGDDLARELGELDAADCDLLVVLGDLFHVWVGDPRYETEEIRRLLPALEGVRRRGIETRYVEGNRDFFLEDSVYAARFDSIAREHAFERAGVRYLAVHGDGLNDHDWRYRFWRRASKNPLSRAAARRLPGSVARRWVHAMDRRLSETNFEHKARIPEAVIKRYAEARLAEGHDVLLLGHFHEPRRFVVNGGEVRIVDAWFRARRLEWLP